MKLDVMVVAKPANFQRLGIFVMMSICQKVSTNFTVRTHLFPNPKGPSGEVYFVLVLFGIEFAINMGAPHIEGYINWLEISPAWKI
jgi:hypothetical protein